MSIDQYYERTPVRASELDIVGSLFGIKFLDDNLVALYIEDDEWYHLKAKFSKDWLLDLGATASRAKFLVDEISSPIKV